MSKLITRASVNGATLAGANLKAALLGIVDALNSAGLQEGSRATISASSTLTTTQCGLLLVDCTAGNVVLTLPTSGAATDDASYIIRRIDSSANTLTIQRGGADNIEGAATSKTIAANGIMVLQMPAAGTNWRVLNISGATPFDALANLGINTLATTGTAPTYAVATPVLYGLVAKSRLRLQFNAASNGAAATLAVNGGTAKALKQYDAAGAKINPVIAASQIAEVEYDGTDQVILNPLRPVIGIPAGHINGLELSPTGASATMPISAGQAADSTGAVLMTLASAINKTTSAWAVGNNQGGLDTGTIANSTWYDFYEIYRSDTGVVDVAFCVSGTALTLPASYTHKRLIGSGLTNGSGQWTKIVQDGDNFTFDTPALDVSTVGSGTAAVTVTMSLPRGRNVFGQFNVAVQGMVYMRCPDFTDLAPSLTVSPLISAGYQAGGQCSVRTNTLAQIGYRCNVNGTLYVATLGWTDPRGRDA